MISLLRKIRQKLLQENRVTRYLIYAFGEIFLVVIGILIALQVNNWNQERVEKRKSNEFHQRLSNDLDQIIRFLAGIEEYSNLVANQLDEAVEILESGQFNDSSKRVLDFAFGNYFRLSRHLPELSTYEEMKSSGQLGLIYNLELREELSKYITQQKLVSTIYEDLNEKVNQTTFMDPYLKFEQGGSVTENAFCYDFSKIRQDQVIINTLSRYAFHWKSKSSFSRSLQNQASELNAFIQKEIETSL